MKESLKLFQLLRVNEFFQKFECKTTDQGFPGGAVVKNRLPMQGTRVRSLVWEDPTCRGAKKPQRHNS